MELSCFLFLNKNNVTTHDSKRQVPTLSHKQNKNSAFFTFSIRSLDKAGKSNSIFALINSYTFAFDLFA